MGRKAPRFQRCPRSPHGSSEQETSLNHRRPKEANHFLVQQLQGKANLATISGYGRGVHSPSGQRPGKTNDPPHHRPRQSLFAGPCCKLGQAFRLKPQKRQGGKSEKPMGILFQQRRSLSQLEAPPPRTQPARLRYMP